MGTVFTFSTKIGPSTERSSRATPSGALAAKKGALLLGVEGADRAATGHGLEDGLGADLALEGRRADERSRHDVDLDLALGQAAEPLRQLVGHDGPQLHDRVVDPALHPASTHHDARLVEREVGGVEEEHLPDLGLERVEAQPPDRRTAAGLGNGDLEVREGPYVREGQGATAS